MKLSISNIAWLTKTDRSVAETLSLLSIKHIDVTPFLSVDTLDQDPSDFLLFWKKYGVTPLGMQSLFFGRPEKIFRNRTSLTKAVEYFSKVVSLADKLGVSSMVFGSPKQRMIEENFVEPGLVLGFFTDLADLCCHHDIVLCLEPNAKCYGTNFLNTTYETVDFIKKIDHNFVKLNFDTGTILSNGLNPIDVFENVSDHVGHIHISAQQLKPVHEGLFDHESFKTSLVCAGYDKGIAIEMLTSENNRKKEIRRALDTILIYGEK